ncbi:hypothetical protein K450DRAFT_245903 [Umbelopsis ramanniana AG]|uniref:Uncharacterized protein n=1 Tax=Umbelopsis ramanniana AG TaxID=1314678 RepID=A0AAD5E952_UMBRA|nr:uncharacterized protein K450DRAFT_245903 [Umbelopsis ramanniana AG]KAI8578651.1 hypothetical protein K450DRAFT_245903 [Umbelopsis ramanniana AG]
MKFGTSKLLISAAVAIAFPSLSNASPFFSHLNDASTDDLSQKCSDFQITSPSSTAAVDWTPGSLQTISWEAPSSYSSVSIALLDSNNQTISDFGTYDASQGNTGQKEISLQGHPSGLYHLKFTALKADGECEIDSNPIQISASNSAPSTNDLDDIFSKLDGNQNTNDSPTTPPSNQELDDIFNDLYNHGNDEGWHVDEDDIEDNDVPSTVSGWHSNEDDVEEIDFSGWHSNEDDVEENETPAFGHSDAITDLVNDVENSDLTGWHSNEDDVEENEPSGWHSDDAEENGTPTFGHSDAISDLVNDIENNDVSGWHTNEDDVENDTNSGEPQTFEELIESLDQPYEQYLDNNSATENQPLTTHKNDADVGGDDWTTEDDDNSGDSDISSQLDEIFSKLAGNEQPTTADDVHTDLHWNSEDDTYFTDEYNGVPSVEDTSDHSDAGWHEDDVETPTTDIHSDDDAHSKWVGDGTANADHNDETPSTWFTEDHSDEVPSTGENDATPNKWFTDVHNDEVWSLLSLMTFPVSTLMKLKFLVPMLITASGLLMSTMTKLFLLSRMTFLVSTLMKLKFLASMLMTITASGSPTMSTMMKFLASMPMTITASGSPMMSTTMKLKFLVPLTITASGSLMPTMTKWSLLLSMMFLVSMPTILKLTTGSPMSTMTKSVLLTLKFMLMMIAASGSPMSTMMKSFLLSRVKFLVFMLMMPSGSLMNVLMTKSHKRTVTMLRGGFQTKHVTHHRALVTAYPH